MGVQPDLWCFGKVIGGGLPLATLGGRRDLMSQLAPIGPVYQAGTLSGNPLATAAGLAVLERLDQGAYLELAESVGLLARGLAEAIGRSGLAVEVPVFGTLVSVFFSDEPVRDYNGAARAARRGLFAPFFRAMLARGVALAPSPYEIAFVSLAHSREDIERTGRGRRRCGRGGCSGPGFLAFGHTTSQCDDGLVHGLGRPELVGLQEVRHDPQEPLHERAVVYAGVDADPHQAGPWRAHR